jgi:hypothetical protein
MIGDYGYSQQPQQPAESGDTILTPNLFLKVAGNALPQQLKDFGDIDPNKIYGQINAQTAMIPPYFAVTKNSVIHRIKNLICPFIVKQWSRSTPEGQKCLPAINPNAPELYTPIVFSFFYFLMSSLISGIRGEFSMNDLYAMILKFALCIAIEVGVSKILFANFGVCGTYPALSLAADFSCISFYFSITSIFSWHKYLYWISTLYCAAAAMIWTLRTLNSEPCMAGRQQQQTSQFITYVLFITAVIQALLVFIYTPRTYATNDA